MRLAQRRRRDALWLSQDELAEFSSEMRTTVASRMDNEPALDRSLCLALRLRGVIRREVGPLGPDGSGS
ncbi:hypothetical protein QF035_007318 [Streptomyces umbrinus]|uniref:Uncharacterized protein n=1 Tax=Streptomyces umbrinus TaxID=67370 RepID=A0ABU0T1P4_9ACTN|nr:hypothetical protein [Streptomyces umbrinus]